MEPNRTMYMYSAHDTTIANILNALNVFDNHFPPYASTILVELRRREEEYLVTVGKPLCIFLIVRTEGTWEQNNNYISLSL